MVVKEQSGFFRVEAQDGQSYICRLRGRLLEEAQSSDIAAIGDRVQIAPLDTQENAPAGAITAVIEAVETRISTLSRAARTEGSRGSGQSEREQVIVANAEQAFFVFAAAEPRPSLKLLDRFLVAGEKSRIPHLYIVVNKIDLADPQQVESEFAPYRRAGYTLLYTSARSGRGVDELRALLKDQLSVFTGPSGVGKTSLLNAIEPGLGRAVKSVSQNNFEGMHTTRDSELVKLACGGYLADTPGLRYLNVWDIEPEELDAYFVEIAPLVGKCRFNDCTHHNEPGCAVRAALQKGEISKARYDSYLKLREELEAAYAL
ncbi:MAG: ribosome small subunit-dependent GTPase A [Chloroflexi bacterium]|nr:ribosome small subunit-dependent GTPase A [Chloroflexota bacterium]